MRKLLFIAAVCAVFTSLESRELKLDNWKCYHAKSAKFVDGNFSGIPDAGASLVSPDGILPVDGDFNRVEMRVAGRSAEKLAVSLRGEKNLHVTAKQGIRENEFYFDFDKLPKRFRQMRLYFNYNASDTGKRLEFRISRLALVKRPTAATVVIAPPSTVKKVTALPMPERTRVFDRTYLFPRIHPKYDLMKNYLGGYSLGTGTFFDRPLFFDRSLAEKPLPLYDKLNTQAGFIRQLQSAREFVDGCSTFFMKRRERFFQPLKFANASGIRGVLFMEIASPQLNNFKVISEQIDAALASAAVFKHNGALVIGSYHGEVYTPDQWRKLLAPYRDKYGKKVLFMCEMRGLCYRMAADFNKGNGAIGADRLETYRERVRAYLTVVDGINFSGSNHLTAKRPGFPENVFNAEVYERFIVPLLAGVLAEKPYNGIKLLGLSVHKGYAQVRNTTSNVDEEGTAGMRRSFNAAIAANPDYIIMPEWGETNENTHIEPLVSDAQTHRRLLEALRGRGIPEIDRRYPNLILSFRQENDLAAPIPIELLGLPDASAAAYRVTLRLLSPEGKILKSFPAVNFSHRGIEPVFHLEPAKNYANFRYITPELVIEQHGEVMTIRRGLPQIRLVSAPNFLHRYVKIPLRDLPNPNEITTKFTFDGKTVGVSGRVKTSEKIASIELLADDIPLAAVDMLSEFTTPVGMVMLCWRRQSPLVSGLENAMVRMTVLKGKVKARSPHQYSMAGMAVPVQRGNILQGAVGGGSCVREFWFFASPDAELEITDRGESTVVKVAEVLKNRRFRRVVPGGISWQVLSFSDLPELPMPLDVTGRDYRLSAPATDRPNAVYILRVVTRAGRVFRSEAFMTDKPAKRTVSLPIWNLLTDSREVIQVPESVARDVCYRFDSRLGDLLPNNFDCRDFDGVLGGFDYRTHSSPGWNLLYSPVWQRGGDGVAELEFRRGSGVILPQPLFSRSAFTIDMEVCFDDVNRQTLLDTIGNSMRVRIVDGRLGGQLITSRGKFGWESDLRLEPGRFYRLSFAYDLARFTVKIDGEPAVTIPVAGNFVASWVMCVGGAPIKTRAPVTNVLYKAPKFSDAPNAGFDFSGKLRALRIRNY